MVRFALLSIAVWVLLCDPLHACTRPAGFSQLDSAPVIVFGEYHGTNEIPDFFYNVVCTAAQESTDKLLVGLELPTAFNDDFNDIGKVSATVLIERIRDHSFWHGFKDGRASQAMLTLVEKLIVLESERKNIALVAFAGRDTDVEGANVFATAMRRSAATKAFALVGNAHAQLQPLPGGADSPMAATLVNVHGLNIMTLDISAGGGESWACFSRRGPGSPSECSAFSLHPRHGVEGIYVSCLQPCTYHGDYHIDELSISSPVRE